MKMSKQERKNSDNRERLNAMNRKKLLLKNIRQEYQKIARNNK